MLQAVTCPTCGAPAPLNAAPRASCTFCGATLQQDPNRARAAVAPAPPTGAERPDEIFRDAFTRAVNAGQPFRSALLAGASAAFGSLPENVAHACGAPEAIANAVANLTAKFLGDSKIDVSRDAIALARFYAGYTRAKVELASSRESEIHLPFLGVNDAGPAHFQTKLDAALASTLETPPRW